MHTTSRQLSDKQNRFVEEYLVDLNATSAAARAGYSKISSGKIGSQLLAKTRIQNEIQKRMTDRSNRIIVTSDKILSEMLQLAFANPLDLLNIKDGSIEINVSALTNPILCKLIEGITFSKNGISLRFINKSKLLSTALCHLPHKNNSDENKSEVLNRLKKYLDVNRK